MTPRRRAELLQYVLDVWELHGAVWTQGSYGQLVQSRQAVSWAHRGARGYCIVGALELVGVRYELVRDELAELYEAIERVVGVHGTFALERWNDVPGRSYAQVRNALELAISSEVYA